MTQDEPVAANPGDPSPDAVIVGGAADLRAQRVAAGNGRVYRLEFSATDGKGGSCTGAVTVGVPKKAGQPAVDDGQVYRSTGGA